jgi:hypothetical protein
MNAPCYPLDLPPRHSVAVLRATAARRGAPDDTPSTYNDRNATIARGASFADLLRDGLETATVAGCRIREGIMSVDAVGAVVYEPQPIPGPASEPLIFPTGPEPRNGDVIVSRAASSAAGFTLRQSPGVVQFAVSDRDEAVRIARCFALAHGVDVWWEDGLSSRLLEACRRTAMSRPFMVEDGSA